MIWRYLNKFALILTNIWLRALGMEIVHRSVSFLLSLNRHQHHLERADQATCTEVNFSETVASVSVLIMMIFFFCAVDSFLPSLTPVLPRTQRECVCR